MPGRLRRAFTLIELLVVVAIIGILLSILLPSLKAAKSQARARLCTSNLRQLAIGWTMYASEFNDHLPGSTNDYIRIRRGVIQRLCWLGTYRGSGGDDERYVPYQGTIFPYVGKNVEVYKCPEDKLDKIAQRDNGQVRQKTLYSYTAPPLLSGAPVGLLLRSRWVEKFGRFYNTYRGYKRGKATGHSLPWMIVEEDEAWYLAFVTDSAWSNDDSISERHDGKGAIAHLDGSVKLYKFQREPARFNAWKLYYELTDRRVVTAGVYSDSTHGGLTFGYITRRGIAAEVPTE